MYVIMSGEMPKAVCFTEADAQELILDLTIEEQTAAVNYLVNILSRKMTFKEALARVPNSCFWYKKVEII